MININILNKGDTVLSINDQFLAVKRKDGTVDIYNVAFSENGIVIDPVKSACIGYGKGTVEMEDSEEQRKVIMF